MMMPNITSHLTDTKGSSCVFYAFIFCSLLLPQGYVLRDITLAVSQFIIHKMYVFIVISSGLYWIVPSLFVLFLQKIKEEEEEEEEEASSSSVIVLLLDSCPHFVPCQIVSWYSNCLKRNVC